MGLRFNADGFDTTTKKSCNKSAGSEFLTQLKLWSMSIVPSCPQTRRKSEKIDGDQI
ncbi:MAG: hypothetical protein ISS29_04105 [Candidatus Marinimicrobia bacterium]|nr:hypothetical protein [Candidatus Neomarinimicrobiota bacterium]